MNKQAIVDLVLERLAEELATLAAAVEVAYENATSDQARGEGEFDTRALESSYLAAGQGRRVGELREHLAAWRALPLHDFPAGEPIALAALVELEQRGARDWYFLGPRDGGMEVKVEGHAVFVVTPQSPLGQQLIGNVVGAVVRLGGGRAARVVRVQ